jgi:hypothetical protein
MLPNCNDGTLNCSLAEAAEVNQKRRSWASCHRSVVLLMFVVVVVVGGVKGEEGIVLDEKQGGLLWRR